MKLSMGDIFHRVDLSQCFCLFFKSKHFQKEKRAKLYHFPYFPPLFSPLSSQGLYYCSALKQEVKACLDY